MVLITRNRHDR